MFAFAFHLNGVFFSPRTAVEGEMNKHHSQGFGIRDGITPLIAKPLRKERKKKASNQSRRHAR
jgi:hypothetical protein